MATQKKQIDGISVMIVVAILLAIVLVADVVLNLQYIHGNGKVFWGLDVLGTAVVIAVTTIVLRRIKTSREHRK